jgi:predicted adenine nucleotide alpha hydrolase (AANH) superfamily ATPase
MSDALLLHICCAPCLTVTQSWFGSGGWQLTGYFCNPNIHPWSEWERRASALRSYAPTAGLDVIYEEEYPLEANLARLLSSSPRCAACYEDRLGAAAGKAAAAGFGHFSTTLLLSPYQDHGLLRRAGEKAGDEHGVRFEYADLRGLYPESVAISRKLGIYRQRYCGCVFSERDRFAPCGSPGGRDKVRRDGELR